MHCKALQMLPKKKTEEEGAVGVWNESRLCMCACVCGFRSGRTFRIDSSRVDPTVPDFRWVVPGGAVIAADSVSPPIPSSPIHDDD